MTSTVLGVYALLIQAFVEQLVDAGHRCFLLGWALGVA